MSTDANFCIGTRHDASEDANVVVKLHAASLVVIKHVWEPNFDLKISIENNWKNNESRSCSK